MEFIFPNSHESIKISGKLQTAITNGAGSKSWPTTHISTTKREVKMIKFLNSQSLSPVTFFSGKVTAFKLPPKLPLQEKKYSNLRA